MIYIVEPCRCLLRPRTIAYIWLRRVGCRGHGMDSRISLRIGNPGNGCASQRRINDHVLKVCYLPLRVQSLSLVTANEIADNRPQNQSASGLHSFH